MEKLHERMALWCSNPTGVCVLSLLALVEAYIDSSIGTVFFLGAALTLGAHGAQIRREDLEDEVAALRGKLNAIGPYQAPTERG